MHILLPALLASAAAATTLTLPAASNPSHRLNLVGTYARLYQKYNTTIPESLSAAFFRQQLASSSHHTSYTSYTSDSASGKASRDTASSPIHPSALTQNQYVAAVAIGTPPQHFRLNLDTGSSDLWVFGDGVPASWLLGQEQYSPWGSSSSRLVPWAVWLAGYIDFSFVGGIVFTDTVTLGGAGKDSGDKDGGGGLAVEDQGVQVAALAARSIVEDAGMDGILGLGFDELNFVRPRKQRTWFSNVKERLSEPLFTVDFRDKDGKFTFGYIDKAATTGPVTYTPVDASTGYWSWTSSGYAIGSGAFQKRVIKGVLDTGTTISILPDDIVKQYYAQVPGASYSRKEQGWVFGCDAPLPDFTFGVEAATITIPGAYVNVSAADGGQGKCVGGIQSGDRNLVVFGAVALKAGVAVFDAGQMRIGWANKTLG